MKQWVGSLVALIMLLMSIGTAVSAPSQGTQSDHFERPDLSRWVLIQGNLSADSQAGSQGDKLTWLVVADDTDATGTGPSRVVANASHVTNGSPTWNTASASYYFSATLERHENYTAPAANHTPTVTAATGPAANTTGGGTPPAGGGATTATGNISASLTPDGTSGFAPYTVSFVLDSTHPDAANLSWSFDKNSNTVIDSSGTGLPQVVTATYTAPGTKIAKLMVTNGTDSGEATIEILVSAAPPLEVTLAASGTLGTAPTSVQFDVTSPDPASSSWSWAFDADGDSTPDATGLAVPANASFVYTTAGTYTAVLTVSDGTNTGVATIQVTVTEPLSTQIPALGGALGLTFGEQPGGGYYTVLFNDTHFTLGIPNSTTGAFDILEDAQLEGWGGVDPRKQDIGMRHKYAVEVDGTSVTVLVDNWKVGSFLLPGVPQGTFGFITDEDTRLNVGETHWQPLDKIAPTIDIIRPKRGSIYVQDVGVEYSAGTGAGPAFVQGDMTIAANVTDNIGGVGVKSLSVYVDGKFQGIHGNANEDTQIRIPTGDLSPGYHTIRLRAFDHQLNMREESVRIFVLNPNLPDGHTLSSPGKLVEELPLPPL